MTVPGRVTIGNVYAHGFSEARVAEFERLGFEFRPGVGHYAGAQVTRFIDFEEGPALEVVDVSDAQAYEEFCPEGMVPYCPGISLLLPEATRGALKPFEERASDLRPYRLHVNYDGSSDPGKPGWTYLNFGRPPVRDTFIYLMVREEPRLPRPDIVAQPNRVRRVRGVWFDLETRELQRLADLVGVEIVDGAFRIGDVAVWSRDGVPERLRAEGKRFPLQAIFLEAPDHGAWPSPGAAVVATTFRSRPALRCRTNPLSWDLLLLESPASPRRGGRRPARDPHPGRAARSSSSRS